MTDPITREQVERLIVANREAAAGRGSLTPMSDVLGPAWRDVCPAYVVDLCHGGTTVHMWPDFIATLTRWRDELAAAEPVRRVPSCGMCGEPFGPALSRAHGSESGMCTECWGGAPAEDSPERLRERREALGWTLADAAAAVRAHDRRFPHLGACHIEAIERPHACGPCNSCAAYAAALSAEEARRAKLAAESERPAPRFKVGDWVRDGSRGFRVAEMHWDDSDVVPMWYARAAVGVAEGIAESSLESYAGPASPPAPEVVDVPLPIVKRCGMVEATWYPHAADVVTVELDDVPDVIDVPIALLRAMLADIDAQQGGAS